MSTYDENISKQASKPLSEVRRNDNEKEDEGWIKALLRRGTYGTVGTSHENQPFVTPTIYHYEEQRGLIYFHSASSGRMLSNIETNPLVSFCVVETGRLLPHQDAVDFNIEYNSVVVFGKAEVIKDEANEERALQMLLDKYAPHLKAGTDYNTIKLDEIKRTTVYALTIEEWSGKQQKEPDDYPGAFVYKGTS